MKKLLLILVLTAVLCGPLHAATFVKGQHYMPLDMPVVENAVWEVYSVFCPYCEQYEKLFSQLTVDFPGAECRQIYYARYGQYGPDSAKVLAAMKSISDEKYKTVKAYYFDEIITNRGKNTSNVRSAQFTELGVNAGKISADDYQKALNSDKAQQLLAEWADNASRIVAQTGSIPAIVINGRYLINMAHVNSYDTLKELVSFLLKLKEEPEESGE